MSRHLEEERDIVAVELTDLVDETDPELPARACILCRRMSTITMTKEILNRPFLNLETQKDKEVEICICSQMLAQETYCSASAFQSLRRRTFKFFPILCSCNSNE